jgi:pyruvate formate lyase activating enzyme
VEGGQGWCRTRLNQSGKLYTLIYGVISSLSANPIEKKPFYHFYPGTRALTAGGWGCNFGCPWCQNWDISKWPPPETCQVMTPEEFVHQTRLQGCQGTSISFNEPTLSLEWSLEVFRLAKGQGLYNTYVTNGYMTARALGLLIDAGLDAMNVDLKGDAPTVKRYCKGIDVERVWERCRQAVTAGIHLEITTLVIPGINDDEDILRGIAQRIASELGPDVPWHVSAYFPAYRFSAPPTRVTSLERAWSIGKQAGLNYVYLGNVPGHPYDNTYCPHCDGLLIRRFGFSVVSSRLTGNRCPDCGGWVAMIPGEGKPSAQFPN